MNNIINLLTLEIKISKCLDKIKVYADDIYQYMIKQKETDDINEIIDKLETIPTYVESLEKIIEKLELEYSRQLGYKEEGDV